MLFLANHGNAFIIFISAIRRDSKGGITLSKLLLVANTDWYLYNFRLSLARFLASEGFEVVMVSPPGQFTSMIEKAGFRWVEWKIGRRTSNPLLELLAIRSLRKIYAHEQPELVHQFTIKPVLYGSLAARSLKVGVVNSITGLGYVFGQGGLSTRILRLVALTLYRLAFQRPKLAVIFENGSDYLFFVRHRLVRPEISTIIGGVGVDEERFIPLPEEPGKPLIILPGRMLWDKGIGVLVEAARLLHRRCEVRIALVGGADPGNPSYIPEETIAKWVEEGAIEWWGFKEDMLTVYQQAHIIALPSVGEGLSTALIEAAACGRPIVAADVPGCREVVIDQQNGFLVPPNNPQALADALEKLVRDPTLRSKMGAAGRQRVLDHYTIDRINTATLEFYNKII
jgi:glycosyltransferase involved in cell wall biosynthesis